MYEISTASDHMDLLEKLNTFLTATGSAFNLSYSGTGNGTLGSYKGGSASVAETFTITATSSTNFTVVGSVTGALSDATVGTPYTGTKIQFTITAGATPFVAGDVFTLSTAPKWASQRNNRIKAVLGSMTEKYLAFNYQKALSDGFSSTCSAYPATLGCQLASAVSVYAVVITPDASGVTYAPKAFDLQYSDDGSSWTTLQSYSGLTSSWTSQTPRTFTVTSPASHAYWRINVTDGNNATLCNIGRLEFRNASSTVSHWDIIWKAPGNDGAQSIYVGVMPFAHVSADYYNWRIGGFSGFTEYQTFSAQAGPCVDPVMPLWNSSIAYWFVADGARVKIMTKVSSQYECAYMGYIDSYLSPGQYPYPVAIGASTAFANPPVLNSSNWRWSYNSTSERHAFCRGGQASINGDNYCNFRLRNQAGTWQGYTANTAGDGNSIWPSFTVMTDLRPNLDDSYTLYPYIINNSAPNCWGEISGVAAISGYSNGAENIITIGTDRWVVMQDVTRTTTQSYFAVKLN